MTTWVGYSNGWKAWLLRSKERGEELKVLYHASAAAACDGNLPYIMAICLYSQQYRSY
jgi:hypothetical protein